MIDLLPEHLSEVRRILSLYAPGRDVVVFGSRATGKARLFSDLDLALSGEPLAPPQMQALKDAFSASNLPMSVDVVEQAALSEGLRARILREGAPLA